MLGGVLADTDYVRAAYVRGGRPAVLEAVLFQLHLLGLIVPARRGSVRREHTGVRLQGIERVVCNAVVGSVAPFALSGRPRVDEALQKLRASCVRAGLIRRGIPASVPLARRRSGRTLVAQLRRDYPLESGEDLTMLVALYGRDALLLYAERFARASGLLDRSGSDDFRDEAGPQGNSGLEGA
jgi:hypothetical protein